MDEIKEFIKQHIDEKFGKNKLRKNYSRYMQVFATRGKNSALGYIHGDIAQSIKKVLEQMDNEFLTENSFRDKIKEVSEDYGDER